MQDLSGPSNSGEFCICPWTFLIMNGQTQGGPVPSLTVNEGDSVFVEISQVSGTECAIYMADQTLGQSWEYTVTYTGTGSSAERIVEDPVTSGQGCDVVVNDGLGQCPMAPYYPLVSFTGLGVNNAEASTYTRYETTFVNSSDNAISAPSVQASDGSFTVTYTGPPNGAGPGTAQLKAHGRIGHTLATP